jgi:hypothetical protein
MIIYIDLCTSNFRQTYTKIFPLCFTPIRGKRKNIVFRESYFSMSTNTMKVILTFRYHERTRVCWIRRMPLEFVGQVIEFCAWVFTQWLISMSVKLLFFCSLVGFFLFYYEKHHHGIILDSCFSFLFFFISLWNFPEF